MRVLLVEDELLMADAIRVRLRLDAIAADMDLSDLLCVVRSDATQMNRR